MKKRQRKTRPVFDNDLILKDGMYMCAVCGNRLLISENRIDHLSGWPISIKPIESGFITRLKPDTGNIETEIVCSKCESHLGRVVREDSRPKAVRYCIESIALNFQENG
jgi:peptide-methionine (R)-S-oxide reductase